MTLADYTAVYDPDTDFDARYTHATTRAVLPYVRPGDRVLELGCATGLMTAALAGAGAQVLAVDRSEPYLRRLAARELPGVRSEQADLEAYRPAARHDHVVATNLLHELADREGFLARTAEGLSDHGLLHLSVPNPRSLHRLVALQMGLLEDLTTLSERAERLATRVLLDADAVRSLAARAGLEVVATEGVFLKPLPNHLLADLDDDVLEGFVRVARLVPDLCALTLFRMRRA